MANTDEAWSDDDAAANAAARITANDDYLSLPLVDATAVATVLAAAAVTAGSSGGGDEASANDVHRVRRLYKLTTRKDTAAATAIVTGGAPVEGGPEDLARDLDTIRNGSTTASTSAVAAEVAPAGAVPDASERSGIASRPRAPSAGSATAATDDDGGVGVTDGDGEGDGDGGSGSETVSLARKRPRRYGAAPCLIRVPHKPSSALLTRCVPARSLGGMGLR